MIGGNVIVEVFFFQVKKVFVFVILIKLNEKARKWEQRDTFVLEEWKHGLMNAFACT